MLDVGRILLVRHETDPFLLSPESETEGMNRKEEESYMAENNGKSLVTARQIMRFLSFICIVVVFCPSFLVSCSGQSKGISILTAAGGLSVYGETIAKPQPLMLVCLLLPAVILALLFMKKLSEKQNALIIAICGISDFVIWMIFKAVVKKIAEDHYCEFKTTGWYLLNNLALFFLILFALLILLQKLEMDTDILALLSGGGTERAMNKMSESLAKISDSLTKSSDSVTKRSDSATKASDSPTEISKTETKTTDSSTEISETQTKNHEVANDLTEKAGSHAEEEEEKPKFCQECGKPLDPDAAFCKYCGTKC